MVAVAVLAVATGMGGLVGGAAVDLVAEAVAAVAVAGWSTALARAAGRAAVRAVARRRPRAEVLEAVEEEMVVLRVEGG